MPPQSLAGQGELQLFEKSGEFLSTVSTVSVSVCACVSLGDHLLFSNMRQSKRSVLATLMSWR